ncbi:MAG: heparinase II/III family protein [Clostridiales bacterium]|nr:heparinase II/III family protein [Clostridiales bacterium]
MGMERMRELLDRFDYRTAGMEEAGELYEKQDYEGCMEAVVKHFRTRTTPVYLFTVDDMKSFQDSEVLSEAEDVMNHKIYGHSFPGEIEWDFNPTTETSRDNEWSWSLFRHIYWQPLARAYVMTGDERYTREFLHQMVDFGEHWPAKPFMEDDTFETKFQFPGHAWRTIETAMRIYTSWLPCMEAFRRSEVWEKEDWVWFLTQICDHADFLMDHYSNHNRSSNWLTMESGALLISGIMFPEIRSDWRLTGYQRVMHEIRYSFDNDGIHMERTPIYHMVAAGIYTQCYRLCMANDIPVAPYALPILEKSARFLLSLVKPDFSTPMIGDADRNDLLGRRCDTSLYEGMNLTFHPTDLNEMRAYFHDMYRLTGREDYLWLATGRKEGKEPEQRNYAYKEAGIYVMRTGWGPEDSYFHIHGTQLERGEKSSHSHNDTGHLELTIRGEDILTDSGRYIYNSSWWKDWRHYMLSARAHNTLYVDDHEMGTVPGVTRVRGVRTYCHRFEETEDYQIIDISHNGYVYREDPIFHRRRVLRLKGDVYVIDDQVTGLGLEKHDIRLYFNFAFGHLEQKGEGKFTYLSQKERRYEVQSHATKETSYEILDGCEDPIGGWVSYGYAWRKPIPQLAVKTEGPVPVRFVTVIMPEKTRMEISVAEDIAIVKLPGREETWILRQDDVEREKQQE